MYRNPFPEPIFPLKAVPHDWLFPLVAAVIHHGGAGTTAAGLWAGKPSIICPLVGDQPFWGRRVYELGVGSRPIPQRQVTAGNLAAAVTQTLQDRGMQERVAALGQRIAAEDGVAPACVSSRPCSRASLPISRRYRHHGEPRVGTLISKYPPRRRSPPPAPRRH